MSPVWIFNGFLVAHVLMGATGLVSFWVPIATRKGSPDHKRWGRVFAWMMLGTGTSAIGMAICSLLFPLDTHPKLDDAELIRGVFGWMMLYLAVLTINLAWYALLCIRNRRDHARNRSWHNIGLQWLLAALAVNCAVQGALIGNLLMMGISIVGMAAAWTNLRFIHRETPGRNHWQYEHIKAGVGAGISVYTAFLAFGAVRIMPQMALSPLLWSVPLITGLWMIIHFQRDVSRKYRAARAAAAGTP